MSNTAINDDFKGINLRIFGLTSLILSEGDTSGSKRLNAFFVVVLVDVDKSKPTAN